MQLLCLLWTISKRPYKYYRYCRHYANKTNQTSLSLVKPLGTSGTILQTTDAFGVPGAQVTINCNHNMSSMFYLLWYRQTPETTQLELLGHLYAEDYNTETKYKDRVTLTGNAKSHCVMVMSKLSHQDSGVYFCAVREAQWLKSTLGPYKNPVVTFYTMFRRQLLKHTL